MNKLEAILNRLVSYYDKDDKSQIYNILKAFADEFEIVSSEYIDRADNAIGVETTDGRDLDWRWGSFLNIARQDGEDDDTYRKRLSSVANSLQGGTAASIRYAVAISLGLANDDAKAERCIRIYDGWKYPNAEEEMRAFGHVVCVFKFEAEDRDLYYDGIEEDVVEAMNRAKAAGIITHALIEYTRHNELMPYTHLQLSTDTHDQIRKVGI